MKKAFKVEPRLVEVYQSDEEVKELIDMARKLEGVTRNAGKHAGGVNLFHASLITDFSHFIATAKGNTPLLILIRMMWNMQG